MRLLFRTYGRAVRFRDSSRGQITLFMGMMMVTFLILIMFVINIGMLVHAKINLQNAADLAAYAGASVMARHMNNISYLNYDMRQQYKAFLLRYQVIGNRFYDSAQGLSGTDSRQYFASGTATPFHDYEVPVVCIQFATRASGNFCRVRNLPRIPQATASNPAIPDPINDTLAEFLRQAERNRQNKCQQIAFLNGLVLHIWLFNVDPTLSNIEATIAANTGDPNDEYIQGLRLIRQTMFGIGLVPRNIITLERIKTLQYYVNFPPQADVGLEAINTLQSSGDIAARERTIQAFFSAYYTLGANSFPANTIQMTEMLPTGGPDGGADLLELEPLRVDFNTYFLAYQGSSATGTSTFDQDCAGFPRAHKVLGVPVAVQKNLEKAVYYAVKLKARPRVLFSPFADLTMTAYAAAKPFGSRIGPRTTEADWVAEGRRPNLTGRTEEEVCGAGGCLGIPNLILSAEAPGDINQAGFFRSDIHGGINQSIGESRLANGSGLDLAKVMAMKRAIMSPNPNELGQYNIFSDQPDSFHTFFDRANPGVESSQFYDYRSQDAIDQELRDQYHAIYAPISSDDQDDSEADDEILASIEQAAEDAGEAIPGQEEYMQALQQEVQNFLNRLRSQSSEENGESETIAMLKNPLHKPPLDSSGTEIQLPPDIQMSAPLELRTSWANQKNSSGDDPIAPGRIGYSVKFVALSDLVTGNIQNDLSTNMTNTLGGDVDFEPHRERITH